MAREHEKKYVEGLNAFLEASEEDKVDVDGILAQLPAYEPGFIKSLRERKDIRILDIGSGNGAKALYLARRLEGMGINAVVDFLEPKLEQRRKLLDNFEVEGSEHFGRVYPRTIGDMECGCEYDIVLVIHSLYEFPRSRDGAVETLEKIRRCMGEDSLCIVITEDSSGDFQRMKREIYPQFRKKAPVSRELIGRSLRKNGFPHTVGNLIEFNFRLDAWKNSTDEELGGHMGFLFSDSLDCPPLNPQECKTVGRWVRKNTRRNGKSEYLWTPDIVIWARKNNGKK